MRLFFAVLLVAAFHFSSASAQYQAGVNNNVILLSHLDQYNSYSNIWGYTDSGGNEYALLGASTGLSIVNITDPAHPVEVDFVPGPNSGWREIKAYSHYAYVVSEGTNPSQYTGVQIVDLSTLPDSVKSFSSMLWPDVDSFSARAHSVSIDDAGYLYVQGGTATVGTGGHNGGVRIFSLADPQSPQPISFYSPRYVHDSFVRNNILFNSNINNGGHVDVLDITDRTQPRFLTSIIYPRGFSHNSGTTEDGNYLITTDEVNDFTVKFWDIRVLWDNDPSNDNNIELVAEYLSAPGTIAHNVHVHGHHAYLSHYGEGVRILDLTDPEAPAEVGYYDTPNAWGVYPYFPSGTFVVSDIPTGLYVLRFDGGEAGTVQGRVTNGATGEALPNAAVHFIEAGKSLHTDGNGEFHFRTNGGTHTIVMQAFPFRPDTSQITLASGATLQHDRALTPALETSAVRGSVRNVTGQALKAKITLYATSSAVADFSLTDSTDAQGNFAFENIFVSSPPLLAYERLEIVCEIPYPRKTFHNLMVNSGSPTVLEVTLDRAEVLVVNDDPEEKFEEYYLSALDSLEITAYVWSQRQQGLAPVSAMPLFRSNTLIWYTGNAQDVVLTVAEQDSISAHLDRGGSLLLTGQNIAESLAGGDFLANRMHAEFVRNTTLLQTRAFGVQSDPVGRGLHAFFTNGSAGASNQISKDVLQPEGIAQACFVYDTTSGTVAGVRVEDTANRSKLVFLGFGLEAVNAGPSPRPGFVGRAEVMRNILGYLGGATSVDEREGEGVAAYHLSQNYPNPFNGQTEIRYQIVGDRQHVRLQIYDLMGREVRTLVDEPQAAGSHRALWDGRNAAGETLASGVYLYQLRAGNFSQVRKMAYVR